MDITTTNVVLDTSTVEITGAVDNSIINGVPSAEVNVPEYALVNNGMYSGSLVGQIPGWIDNAITSKIATNDGILKHDILLDVGALLDALEIGVNQSISTMQTDLLSQSNLITTVKSELEGNIAGVISDVATKVDAEGARTAVTDIVGSKWLIGNEAEAESYVLGQVDSYASDNLTYAYDFDQLSSIVTDRETGLTATASALSELYTSVGINPDTGDIYANSGYLRELAAKIGNIEAKLVTEEGVFVGTGFHVWDGVETLETGMIALGEGISKTAGVIYQYLVAGLGPDRDGWVATDLPLTALDPVPTSPVQTLKDYVDDGLYSLQNQVDGNITSWFYDYVPDQTKEPWATWIATDTANGDTVMQDNHLGDLFYNLATGYAYRFAFSSVYGWNEISDTAVTQALADAANAQATADGKNVIFGGDTPPTGQTINGVYIPLDDNDMWIPSVDNGVYKQGKVYLYNKLSTEWNDATSYADNQYVADIVNGIAAVKSTLATALNDIAGLEETNDGVVNSFYQITAPIAGMSYGDWWVDTSTTPITTAYRYEDIDGKNVGTLAWRDNSTSILGAAYIGMSSAQATADGKIKSFYQSSIPTSEGEGDIWIDTDDSNKTYRAAIKGANEIVAGEWERITDDSALDNFITAIYAQDMLDIGNQLDGVAVTYFQSTQPYTTGTTENNGDVWFDTDTTNMAYRYTVDNGWTQITNSYIINTLYEASKTKAAADRSIQNFVGDENPTNYFEGDTWFDNRTGDIRVCNTDSVSFKIAHWTLASKYTDDTVANTPVSVTTDTYANRGTGNKVGDLHVTTDRWYNELGTGYATSMPTAYQSQYAVYMWDGTTWVFKSKDSPNITSVVWAGGASKLLADPTTGAITGWSFGDGSNAESEFTIKADNFYLENSSIPGYKPFSVNGSNVQFNGVVSFSNTNMDSYTNTNISIGSDGTLSGAGGGQVTAAGINAAPNSIMYNTTTIDGGKIYTGSITADQINTNAVTGKNITGGNIYGAYITGAVIKASYIDYSTVQSLTNWKSVTDINTIPSQYWGNFAQGESGPITDSEGYYRLYSTDPIVISPTSRFQQAILVSTDPESNIVSSRFTYDYYQVAGNKLITNGLSISTTLNELIYDSENFGSGSPASSNSSATYNIFGNNIEVTSSYSHAADSYLYKYKIIVNSTTVLDTSRTGNVNTVTGYYTLPNSVNLQLKWEYLCGTSNINNKFPGTYAKLYLYAANAPSVTNIPYTGDLFTCVSNVSCGYYGATNLRTYIPLLELNKNV